MQETVGKVVLDYQFYPGEDLYCDGDVEDRLLELVKNHRPEEFPAIIEKENNWPVLYHLSPLRANIVNWLPMKPGSKVLEIGSGCGAITGALAKNGNQVTCVDLSKKRSLINAYRNKERDNICIMVGNFQDIEPALDTDYDYILLIGVFEYAMAYIGGENPYTEFLNIVKKHLKADGKIVIAIENRLGMKYFAGCREDHLGDYFSGLEDYPAGGVVRTFSRPGLEQICKACGISEYSFYYPYPDYKFMTTLYSDRRLPRVGELTNNLRNFDRDRLLLFDETKAFDSVIREETFPLFSNSYLLLIGKEEEVVYSKFSNDRAEEYILRTDMLQKAENDYEIRKCPLGEKSGAHMDSIAESEALLKARFAGSDLEICPCRREGEELVFPYLEGATLEELLDEALQKGKKEAFCNLLKTYAGLAAYHKEDAVTDYDFIFSNIICPTQGNWKLIDYEWTYSEAVPPEDIIRRALFCYLLGSGRKEKMQKLNLDITMICTMLHAGEWNEDEMRAKEEAFQNRVTKSHRSMSQMRDSIHMEVLPLTDAVLNYQDGQAKERVQIYFDQGSGFSEENSFFVMPKEEEKDSEEKSIAFALPEGCRSFRVDPAMESCVVTIKEIYGGDENGEVPIGNKPGHNGCKAGEKTYVFAHEDPNFTFVVPEKKNSKQIRMVYEIAKVPHKMAEDMCNRKKRLW
ncbi:MAG: class I SAM-dependent methyltransferase [Lachnospiraceae bacterium]|nr:class I SAM-dependent methyltransferase [Lachnospiraceae bacterium]